MLDIGRRSLVNGGRLLADTLDRPPDNRDIQHSAPGSPEILRSGIRPRYEQQAGEAHVTSAGTVETHAPASHERHGILLFSLFAWTMSNLDQSLFGYAVPGIISDLHIGLEQIGQMLSFGFIVAAVMVVFAGLAADRYGRRWTLAGLLAASALFVGLHGFVTSVSQLALLRALAFGLAAGLAPITAAYVAESAPARHRGILMGVLQCGYPLGWFLAAMIAAPLLDKSGWRSIFLVGFAVIPIAFLIAWRLPESRRYAAIAANRSSDTPSALDFKLLRELFSHEYRARSLAAIVLFFAFGCAYSGTAFFFPTYFMEVRGYTPAQAAQLVGISNGIAVLGYLSAAYVGEYLLTRRNTYAIWCALGAGALLGLLWLPHERWQDLALFALTAAFFYGSNAVVGTLLADLYPTRMRTTGYAVCGSAPLSAGFALFPSLVPLAVAAVGWQWALSALIVPLLVVSAAAALVLPNILSGLEVADR
jgi:MFS family permease